MGCGNSKQRRSSSPPLLIQRLGSAKMGKEHARHSLISDMDSFQPPANRKQSCLSVLDAPVRRLSLSIPDAGKTGDTISIRTTNVHMNSEDTVQQPVEDVVVSTTQMTASEASLSDSSIQNSVCETKSTDNGKPDQGIAAVAEAGTEEQKQTTVESTAGTNTQLTTKKHRLLNFTFLQRKISSTGIRSALEELSEARKADPDNKDLELLGLTLQLAQDALKYDPQQLPSQLLSRITAPTEGLLPLLEQCRAAQDLFLLSSQPLVLPPGGQLIHTVSEHTGNVVSLTMTADGQYAVTCSEDETVLITDVNKGVRERKILQVGRRPAEVFLCCNDSIIVVTTHFQITAYRFDTGEEIWKLEGKDLALFPPAMCFTGDNRETMILNEHMNVFLYEAATATKLDTVSVPHDRNNLPPRDGRDSKTCARSGYMVAVNVESDCLVSVNLTTKETIIKKMPVTKTEDEEYEDEDEENKDEEEPSIDSLALADGEDGKLYAIYTTVEDKDIYFADAATLDVVKIYKGEQLCYGKFHVTTDQQYLYFPKAKGVCVWDLQNARLSSVLPETRELTDIMTVDMKRFVTITDDRNVRVWDISQGTQPSALQFQDKTIIRMENGGKVVVREGQADKKKATLNIQDCLETSSPRYVILVAEKGIHNSLQVFDVATSTVVRKIDLGKFVDVSRVQGCRVLVVRSGRLRVLNVDTMEVGTVFSGRIHHSSFTPIPIKEGKEILTTTKGGHHVKIYDTATGKMTAIIKQETGWTLSSFMVCKDESVGVAELVEEFLVFDLVKQSVLRQLDYSNMGKGFMPFLSGYCALTHDGHYFLCQADKTLNKNSSAHRTEEFILIYDMQSDTVVKNMLDMSAALTYSLKEDKDCTVSELHLLDNDTLLVSHYDHILRVYDIQSGRLLHRMEGHRYTPTLSVREDNPVFLSYVVVSEESSVRLWRKSDFTPLASFTTETKLQTAMLLPGHSQDFLVVPEDSHTPVVFTVHGQNKQALPGHTTPPLASYPQLFEGIKLDSVLAPLPSPSDLAALDADDPDSDYESEEEDNYEDDDEDDDDGGSGDKPYDEQSCDDSELE